MTTNPHPSYFISRNPNQTLSSLRNSTTFDSSPSKMTFYSYSFTDSLLLHSLFACKPQYSFASFIFPINKKLLKTKEYFSYQFRRSCKGRRTHSIDINTNNKIKEKSLLCYRKDFTNGRNSSVKTNKEIERNYHNNNGVLCMNNNSKNGTMCHNSKMKENNIVNLCLLERYNMLKNRNTYKGIKMRRKKIYYNS